MSYRLTEFWLLVQSKPEEAKRRILRAFKQNGANITHTAEALGISLSSMHRYIKHLEIKAEVDAIQEKARREGWIKSDRWPEKTS